MSPTAVDIARVCHEANRAWQQAANLPQSMPWDQTPEDEQQGIIAGVELALEGATPEELHEAWVAHKVRDGWKWATRKDTFLKTHPCLVPYADLPPADRVKDSLFAAIVNALKE